MNRHNNRVTINIEIYTLYMDGRAEASFFSQSSPQDVVVMAGEEGAASLVSEMNL
jgi:hypothetical protein